MNGSHRNPKKNEEDGHDHGSLEVSFSHEQMNKNVENTNSQSEGHVHIQMVLK